MYHLIATNGVWETIVRIREKRGKMFSELRVERSGYDVGQIGDLIETNTWREPGKDGELRLVPNEIREWLIENQVDWHDVAEELCSEVAA